MNLKLSLILLLLSMGIGCASQTLIPYYDDGKYGYCDTDGNIKIPPQYDQVEFFSKNGIAIVSKDTNKVIIDKTGFELASYSTATKFRLLPATFEISPEKWRWRRRSEEPDTIAHLIWALFENGEGQLLNVPAQTASPRYVIADRDNEHVYSYRPPLQTIGHYHGYFVGEKVEGGFDILDADGVVLKSTVNEPMIWSPECMTFSEGDHSYLIDPGSGAIKQYPYKSIVEVVAGKHLVVSTQAQQADRSFFPRPNTRYGLIGTDGQVVLDTIYERIKPHKGLYVLNRAGNAFWYDPKKSLDETSDYKSISPLHEDLFLAKRHDNTVQLMAPGGQMALEGQVFDEFKYLKRENYYTTRKGEIASILDSTLQLEVSYEAASIHRVYGRNDLYSVRANGLAGIIDANGQAIFPMEYERFTYRADSLFILHKDDKKGLARADGEVLFPAEYQAMEFQENRDGVVLWLAKEGQFASFDLNGKQLTPFQTRPIRLSGRSVNWYREGKTYHFTDKYGEPLHVSSKKYHDGYSREDSVYLVVLYEYDAHYKVIINEVIIEGQLFEQWGAAYDSIAMVNISLGRIAVVSGGQQAVIDVQGRVILPFAEQEITEINNEFFVARKEEQYFLFSPDGQPINAVGYDYFDHATSHGRRVAYRNIPDQFYEYVNNLCFDGNEDTVLKPQRHAGYLDKYGQELMPFEYSYTRGSYEHYTCLTKGYVAGQMQTVLMDSQGEVFLETNYDRLSPLGRSDHPQYFVAQLKEYYGLIDRDGRTVFPFEYTALQSLYKDEILQVRDDKHDWHLISLAGTRLHSGSIDHISGQVEQCHKLPRNRYLFFSNNSTVVVDLDGQTHLSIPSQKVKFVTTAGVDLIEVQMEDYTFYVDKESLVEYRRADN